MGFRNKKEITRCYAVFTLICLRLGGSNGGEDNGLKIFRDEQDIFTNMKCSDKDKRSCTTDQCKMYGAECVSDDNCEYCRCSEGRNTFMIRDGEEECKSDEDIVEESAPEEAFWLNNSNKCLKLEDSSSKFVIGTSCSASPTLDMLWIWTTTGDKQLMNIKTLKCMQSQGKGNKVKIKQCERTSKWQKIICTKSDAGYHGIAIKWSGNLFLHLPSWSTYAVLKYFFPLLSFPYPQGWSSAETSCETSTAYKGCYRFSDGSFLKYLDYGKNPTLQISAPIFKDNAGSCKLNNAFHFFRNGHTEQGNTDNIFSIENNNKIIIKLKFASLEQFNYWNGTLLNLSIVCGNEEHCVLLKLKSLSTYSDVVSRTTPPSPTNTVSTQTITDDEGSATFPSSSETSTETTTGYDPTTVEITTFVSETSTQDVDSSTVPKPIYSKTSDVVTSTSTAKRETFSSSPHTRQTSTTDNTYEEISDETSESSSTNSVAIAVPVALLPVALVLALGIFLWYRRRKRLQTQQNNNNEQNRTPALETSSVPFNPLQPLTNDQSTERQCTLYEEPCEHHYEYVNECAMAPSTTFAYDYAFLDGPLPNSKKRSVELDRIGEEDYVIKNNSEVTSNIQVTEPNPEAKEVETHDDYVVRDKSYVTVIASEPEAKEVETHDDYVVRDKSYVTVLS